MGRKEKGVSTATTVKTPQKINGTSSTANCISSLPLTAEENNHFLKAIENKIETLKIPEYLEQAPWLPEFDPEILLRQLFDSALRSTPPPGRGFGYHFYLMILVQAGLAAGFSAQEVFEAIRRFTPKGERPVPDREIWDAVNKVFSENDRGGDFTPRKRQKSFVKNGARIRETLIAQGNLKTEEELRTASPVSLHDAPQDNTRLFLNTLFEQEDLIWIGERTEPGILGENIRTRKDWLNQSQNLYLDKPHLIINPLDGVPALTKSGGKRTLRGDNNVADFRFCLIEFDDLTMEEQIRFWSAVKLPIVALIHSGGKSLHAWLDVKRITEVNTHEDWDAQIKGNLYESLLIPLGVDSACSNPSRLSRLPGHYRAENNQWQRLLWLSPEGRPVCG